MNPNNTKNNGVNGTGTSCEGPSPGRCSPAQQRGPGRHPTTASNTRTRTNWTKAVNKIVMKCYLKNDPPQGDIDKECIGIGTR